MRDKIIKCKVSEFYGALQTQQRLNLSHIPRCEVGFHGSSGHIIKYII